MALYVVVAGAEVDVVGFDSNPVEEPPAGDCLEARRAGIEVEVLTADIVVELDAALAQARAEIDAVVGRQCGQAEQAA